MQWNTKILALAAASLIATTAGAFAQGYYPNGNPGPRYYGGPRYETYQPQVMYNEPGWSGAMNGSNHPAPSSTQGDVGPEGNNNGTLTGVYRRW
ncbi:MULTISPECIES: hypothetical protein [Bradyrhizobium]|uniref:hypothetical protein n=1 Tax=Bradyrhizobium TaxID=374 RepID=UPI00067EECF9|nr:MULTISPECIES: hypothetical protein [Bradyrhizobium]PAY10948.1 hypothetical protein CK489_02030 [Bradyrhizobium sp. UFLA03-84]